MPEAQADIRGCGAKFRGGNWLRAVHQPVGPPVKSVQLVKPPCAHMILQQTFPQLTAQFGPPFWVPNKQINPSHVLLLIFGIRDEILHCIIVCNKEQEQWSVRGYDGKSG